MYKEMRVFDTKKFKNGLPIKLRKPGLNEEWEYGIVQSCDYETLHYLTVEKGKVTPKERMLHLHNATKYNYTVELLTKSNYMNSTDQSFPAYKFDPVTNCLKIKLFHNEDDRLDFLNGMENGHWFVGGDWLAAMCINVESIH